MIRVQSTWPLLSAFAALALLGLVLVGDYGISWDETQQRLIGMVAFNHVSQVLFPGLITPFPDVPALEHFRDRDYGVVFELPAVVLERALRLSDPRSIYLMRHYLTFLVFLAGVVAMYRMASLHCGIKMAGLLAAGMLLLSPRFFAEAFYNSKDIVFMAFFAIAMTSLFFFLREPKLRTAVAHAFASALAVDVRIMGLLLVATTLTALFLLCLQGRLKWQLAAGLGSLYLLVTAGFVVAMFPFLWTDPWGNLLIAFENMSQFARWGGDVLYFGAMLPGTDLPWHYAPAWIAITTPPVILALLFVGIFATLYRLSKNGFRLWQSPHELEALITLGLLTAPIAAVILLNSVLYNSWRQLYFVYPALLLLATRGAYDLYGYLQRSRTLQNGFIVVLVAAALLTGQWMVRAHPLQNVYFNVFAGADHNSRFELDYWGLANRHALEFLLNYQPAGPIAVAAHSFTPLSFSALILQPNERERLQFEPDKAMPHYLINNYYGWQRHGDLLEVDASYSLIHQIEVVGEVVLSIYQWRANDGRKNSK
jgi:hypothetical protein